MEIDFLLQYKQTTVWSNNLVLDDFKIDENITIRKGYMHALVGFLHKYYDAVFNCTIYIRSSIAIIILYHSCLFVYALRGYPTL